MTLKFFQIVTLSMVVLSTSLQLKAAFADDCDGSCDDCSRDGCYCPEDCATEKFHKK